MAAEWEKVGWRKEQMQVTRSTIEFGDASYRPLSGLEPRHRRSWDLEIVVSRDMPNACRIAAVVTGAGA